MASNVHLQLCLPFAACDGKEFRITSHDTTSNFLRNSLQKLCHIFFLNKSVAKSQGQEQLEMNSDLFQSSILSYTGRVENTGTTLYKNQTQPSLNPVSNCSKSTDEAYRGQIALYVLHILRVQLEPTKACI